MRRESNLFRLIVGGLIYLVATGGALVAGFNYLGRSQNTLLSSERGNPNLRWSGDGLRKICPA